MTASTSLPAGACAGPAVGRDPNLRGRWPSPLAGGARLALALSLRARGLRGLDVLRRSQDRAPPPSS